MILADGQMKPRTGMDRGRVIVAWICTIAAIGWSLVGLTNPERVGFTNGVIFYVTMPTLVIAAVIHLYLIIQWTRPPADEAEDDINNVKDPSARIRKV